MRLMASVLVREHLAEPLLGSVHEAEIAIVIEPCCC